MERFCKVFLNNLQKGRIMKNKNTLILVIIFACIGTASGESSAFSGKVFYNYSHSKEDNAVNGFGFSRVYFTMEKQITDELSYKFQTDVNTGDSPKGIYLKNAKMDWQTGFGKIVIGLQGMNMFKIQENNWGYRYIEKSTMDLYKYSSSADMGMGYYNSMGKLSISSLMTNGTGYKKSENDSKKKLSFQAFYGENKISSKNGFNIGGVLSYEPYDLDSVTVENKTVMGVFGGFAGKGFRLGGEYNQKMDSADKDETNSITSMYGKFSFNKHLTIFGRFDIISAETSENNLIAGIEYQPTKGLCIAPNYRKNGEETILTLNFQFKI